MSSNDLKYTCGDSHNARCTFYEVSLPSWSSLIDEDCVTLEETTSEAYIEFSRLRDTLDFNSVESSCLNIVPNDTIKPLLSEFLNPIIEKVCSIETGLSNISSELLCNTLIAECNIDTQCLQSVCNTSIATLSDLFNALIQEVCDLKTQLNTN